MLEQILAVIQVDELLSEGTGLPQYGIEHAHEGITDSNPVSGRVLKDPVWGQPGRSSSFGIRATIALFAPFHHPAIADSHLLTEKQLDIQTARRYCPALA